MKTKSPDASTLLKEQLLPEQAFIGYCNSDHANKYTSGKRFIDARFIRAAKDEGLLTPLYSVEANVRQPDGSEKVETVDYYSPLQFYIITELRLNIVQDGALWSPETIEWYPDKPMAERPRYIAWGSGMSFNARKNDDPARTKGDDFILNPYALAATFHTFLLFIHTIPLKDRYALAYEDVDIFANAPVFDHDISAIESLPDLLKKYAVDAKTLEMLRANIGRAAAVIDPLELWHYYVDRHPGPKKSLLKGDAQVAQRLYKIYGLITGVWESATGQTPQPFLEFIGGEFGAGFLTPKVEYLSGVDVQAMRQSIDGFKEWACVKQNAEFITPQIEEALTGVTAELDEYEEKYGDHSYAGSYRTRKDEGIPYDQLDDSSKQFFDQIRAQGHDGEDWSLISWAIERRLDDIQRSLGTVYRSVGSQLQMRTQEAWNTHKDLGRTFWMRPSTLSHQEKMVLFQKENQVLLDIAKGCQEKEREFARAVRKLGLAFCMVCRNRPIQLHTDSNRVSFDSQPSICDECVAEKKTAPDNVKDAEWRCPYCGALVYKFVHGNTWSTRTEGHVSVVSELKYGKVELQATCPNRNCKQDLSRIIEYGWLP